MAEQEFGETIEMIIYIVLLAAILAFTAFLSYIHMKVSDSSKYMGSASSSALYLLRGSSLVYHDLAGNPVPYIINVSALRSCKNCIKMEGKHLSLVFNIVEDDGKILVHHTFGKTPDAVKLKLIYPVVFYFDKSHEYKAGYVEVYVGDYAKKQ